MKFVYLGLEIDTVRGQVRVPQVKVQALTRQVQLLLGRPKASLVQIQSLVGSLNFVCKAVAPGRAFLRRLIALTVGLKQPHHKVRLSQGAKLDLVMWLSFLQHYNGLTPFLRENWDSNVAIELFTDAAASIGYGAYFQGRWVQGRWPSEWLASSPSIALLEFFPVVVALICWAPLLANCRVLFRSDNVAVVGIINKQTSPCMRIMQLVRAMVMQCLKFNIIFKAVHIPGINNNIADALSRFQMGRFRALAPRAQMDMTPLPQLPQVF